MYIIELSTDHICRFILEGGLRMTECGLEEKDLGVHSFGLPAFCEPRKDGSGIVFTVRAPSADAVFIVGSFNGWSNADPLEKVGSGIWRGSISETRIQDGDAYKFKLQIGGKEVYLTDPYAHENDGQPYFNSVYRNIPGAVSHTYETEGNPSCGSLPMNVYAVRADEWSGSSDIYSDMARELIPYMMQMGYTHLCLSGVFDEYYDFCSQRTLKAYFAPRKEQGGIGGLCELVHLMHSSGIGVLLDRGVTEISESQEADAQFLEDNARYWLGCYGFDGLVTSAASEGAAKVVSLVCGLLKKEYKHARFIDRNLCGFRISGADAAAVDHDCDLPDFIPVQNESVNICARMAAMSYVLIFSGRGFTTSGCEFGIVSADACRCACDIPSFQKRENSYLQLFVSDLNALYLANPCLWDGNGARTVKRQGDALTVECRGEDGTVFFAADTSGQGCETVIPLSANTYVALDSYSQRYGGAGHCTPYKLRTNRLTLEPYGAVVLVGEGTVSK